MEQTFGGYLRNRRIELGYTLRKFCGKTGLDPAYVSRVENGVHAALENREKLIEFAGHYEVYPDTPEMETLLNLASLSRNQLPEGFEITDPAVLKYLPAFCRTASKQDITREDVEELLRLLRGESAADNG